jgi:hypothetical protein
VPEVVRATVASFLPPSRLEIGLPPQSAVQDPL